MPNQKPMTLALFYRGLLYALREKRAEFIADGDSFHEAFRSMLERAKEQGLPVPAEQLLEDFDPVFGVSPHAAEMVFTGERDFLLSLMNPRLVRATFKISDTDATEALNKLTSADTFRSLANDLHTHLSPSA